MKKKLSLVLTLIIILICLAACDLSKHEHSKSDWKYSETEHWRVPECNRSDCVLEDVVYDLGKHIDESYDHKCDVCEYEIEHEHINGEWLYDEDYHWVSHITCTWGCDVDPGIFEHSDRNGDGKCDECSYALKSDWNQNNLMEDGNIEKVTVSSIPGDYEYSYTGDDSAAIVDYIKNLNLITSFEEDPDEYSGMTWRIFLEYEGGYSTYIYHFGNMFIRSELGSWFKMNYDEASRFDELLNELNGESQTNQENAANEYTLTMNDEEWLYEELALSYSAGEHVTVKIKMSLDMGYIFLVNGEEIASCEDVDGLYWEFDFIMPNADTVIDFKTYDGFLPDANYAVLYEAYWKKNLDAPWVSIRNYYGEFNSGAIVAMIDAGGYGEYEWQEEINGVVVEYNDGNRITVLYEGEFYTLSEAYESGYITSDDLLAIAEVHNP